MTDEERPIALYKLPNCLNVICQFLLEFETNSSIEGFTLENFFQNCSTLSRHQFSKLENLECKMTNTNKDVPFYYSPSGDPEEDKKILEPFEYHFQVCNKNMHSKVPTFLNHWLKISPDKLRQVEEIIHLLHAVCALFDDVQDDGISRGGNPTAHSIYGVPHTISVAHYQQLITFEKTAKLHPMATQIVLEQFLEFNRGQGMDMYLKNNISNSICPNEKYYIKIIASRKSTWTVMTAGNLMKLFSTYKEDLSTIANLVGLYRQIHDDYVNLRIFKESNNDCCDDLAEGKISFLVVHALTNNPNDSQIVNMLKRRPRNLEMKRYFIKLLESYGSFKYTRDVLDKMEKEIETEMDRLGGNPFLKSMMDDFKNDMPESRLETPYVAPLK